MLTFHVYKGRDVVVLRASGTVGTGEWQNTFAAVQRDSEYVPGSNWAIVLMDPTIGIGTIASDVAAQLQTIQLPAGVRPKCAFIIPGGARQKVVDPLALRGVNRRFFTRVFTSEHAALAWIGWSTPVGMNFHSAGSVPVPPRPGFPGAVAH